MFVLSFLFLLNSNYIKIFSEAWLKWTHDIKKWRMRHKKKELRKSKSLTFHQRKGTTLENLNSQFFAKRGNTSISETFDMETQRQLKHNQCNVTMNTQSQIIWENIWTHNLETNRLNATNVIIHPTMQEIWGHIWKHIGEKAYKCIQCDYASSHASNLRRHLKARSGERAYKCNQWDNQASSKQATKQATKQTAGKMQPMWLCILRGG